MCDIILHYFGIWVLKRNEYAISQIQKVYFHSSFTTNMGKTLTRGMQTNSPLRLNSTTTTPVEYRRKKTSVKYLQMHVF